MTTRNRIAAMAIFIVCSAATFVQADVYEDGLKHYRAGRYIAAIETLERKANRSAGEHALLGWSYLRAGFIEEAKRSFHAALALQSDLADAHCGMGYAFFRSGDYDQARLALDRALAVAPSNVDCLVGKGLVLRRQGDNTHAVEWFDRALALDKTNSTAIEERRKILGAKVETERAPAVTEALAMYRRNELKEALPLLQELGSELSDNGDVQLALADTCYRTGDNLAAAKIYRTLIERGVAVDTATRRFLELYGLPSYNPTMPLEPLSRRRPESRQLGYRTHGDYFEYFDGTSWKKTYLMGVNIGPARPGEFASTPSKDVKTYLEWFEQIAAMSSNMVRVYTILPPAFYQALKIHNQRSPRPLWLLHEIWLRETEEKNLYAPGWSGEFEQEIRNVVDIIHGQANVAYRPGHAAGIYTADVSPYVFAIGPGREVEPSIVLVTNRDNPTKIAFEGKYITVKRGNPTEVWFARMMDLTARYEMDRYNAQRPLTIINWPPLDPMYHVTEASYAEELEVRRRRGENVTETAPDLLDDEDVVSVDVMNLHATEQFPAGLFASFHVYTYWPDFLPYDPEYPKVRDREGSNRYYGYLLDLKKHHPGVPLLIAEYGVPTSWGISHVHPDGWNNGGFSERAQAELLSRMSRNIYESGCAGGLVFAWIDEWWKCVADVATNPFDQPPSRRPLWLNMLNPEELFGILGYRPPQRVPLLRGSDEDWRKATILSEKKASEVRPGDIRRVLAYSDTAFLYLRLDVEKSTASTTFDWNRLRYWIALNTLPGKAGIRRIPQLGLELESGANFLVQLDDRADGRIKIASNYTPIQWVYSSITANGKHPWIREGMTTAIADTGAFEDIIVEANRPRFGRDGTVFASINVNRSPLRYGSADPALPDYSTLSAWRADDRSGMIELRIPWGLMYVTDPSARNVMTGTDKHRKAIWGETPGIAVSAIAVAESPDGAGLLVADGPTTSTRIPAHTIPLYTWKGWDEVAYTPYLKESYRALQKVFGELDREFAKK